MNEKPAQILLGDASVLIDLHMAHRLDCLKLLIRNRIAEVFVPSCVYKEVCSHYGEDLVLAIGLRILNSTDPALLLDIATFRDGRLTDADKALLLLAERLHGAVWTGDLRLGKRCRERGIRVYRTMGPIKWLVEHQLLTSDELFATAKAIENVNPYLKGKLMTSDP